MPARDAATFDCVSPIDGRVIAKVAAGDAADVDAAVVSGRAAFERGDWSRAAPKHRKQVLLRFAELLRAIAMSSRSSRRWTWASPLATASAWTCLPPRTASSGIAEAIDKIYDEVAPTGRDALALMTREPLGVVGPSCRGISR